MPRQQTDAKRYAKEKVKDMSSPFPGDRKERIFGKIYGTKWPESGRTRMKANEHGRRERGRRDKHKKIYPRGTKGSKRVTKGQRGSMGVDGGADESRVGIAGRFSPAGTGKK
jgi:hypothetical protein